MPEPAEPVMEVVLCARQNKVEASGNADADYAQAPLGIDVRGWCGLSEGIVDHGEVRLCRLQIPVHVEALWGGQRIRCLAPLRLFPSARPHRSLWYAGRSSDPT